MLETTVREDLRPYVATGRLGVGGTGTVYSASRPGGNARVALKVLHGGQDADVDSVSQCLARASMIAEISHPNIVDILDVGTLANGSAFIAMEHLEGHNLARELVESQTLSHTEVVSIAIQICSALEAAHALGHIHGDLRPDNIFVLSRGRRTKVKVLDFATLPTGPFGPLDARPLLGTPEYWSPEQACRGSLDGRSDIYCLGIIMYEALTGTVPFSSHSYTDIVQQHLQQEPTLMVAPAPQPPIPVPLRDIVLKCLRKDPDERFQTATQLRDALQQLRPPIWQDWKKTIAYQYGHMMARVSRFAKQRPLALAAILLAAGAVPLILPVLASNPANEGNADTATASRKTPNVGSDVQSTLMVSSTPLGAYIYLARGGRLLGITPAELHLPQNTEPVELLVRFPHGERRRILVAPAQSHRIHVRSSALPDRMED